MTEPNEISAADAAGIANVIPSTYVGVKRVEAWPDSTPGPRNPLGQPGYAVRYPDGYVSWSPADVFEKAYHPVPPTEADDRVNAAKGAICGVIPGVTNEAAAAPSGLAAGGEAAEAVSSAPRVSLFDIERKVVAEYAFTPESVLAGDQGVPLHPRLGVATIAVLVLENGHVVTGFSAPVSEGNFNEELGRRFAREDAIRQVQGLEAYLLRQRLFAQQQAYEALQVAMGGGNLKQLGTDAWLWAETFCVMLDGKGAFPDAEARTEFQGIALGWFANAIERARDEGLRQNPSFDPDAPETPNFKAILDDEMQEAGYPNADSLSTLVLHAATAAMGRAYAKGLARTTFPSRQMGDFASEFSAHLAKDFPKGETTPLYQISGPDLAKLQRALEIAEPVSCGTEIADGLKIIAEVIAERDGGIMVGGALCDVGRPEGAEQNDDRPGHDPRTVAREMAERAGSGEEELKERPEAPAPEAVHHREQHEDGPVRGFEIGQGFVRGSDRDPAGSKE